MKFNHKKKKTSDALGIKEKKFSEMSDHMVDVWQETKSSSEFCEKILAWVKEKDTDERIAMLAIGASKSIEETEMCAMGGLGGLIAQMAAASK